jgi:dTDP-4-dehydrorhamnose 3,5-epimerase
VSGAVFDVVVDIRVGSPTYGQWDSVLLDTQNRRSIYLAAGLAHGFLALHDDSTVMYLCSAGYDPQREHTICATDPAIGIDWPADHPLVLSARDRDAPSLAEVRAAGLLPDWKPN